VQVTVLADGHVADARVEQSSGVAGLDDAAREAVRTWTYLPATVDGYPVPSVRNITIPFVLHDPVEPKGD